MMDRTGVAVGHKERKRRRTNAELGKCKRSKSDTSDSDTSSDTSSNTDDSTSESMDEEDNPDITLSTAFLIL